MSFLSVQISENEIRIPLKGKNNFLFSNMQTLFHKMNQVSVVKCVVNVGSALFVFGLVKIQTTNRKCGVCLCELKKRVCPTSLCLSVRSEGGGGQCGGHSGSRLRCLGWRHGSGWRSVGQLERPRPLAALPVGD